MAPSPALTLRNAVLTASFSPDDLDVLRGAGALVADAVLLGTIDAGPGQGDLTARSIPDDEAPAGLPGRDPDLDTIEEHQPPSAASSSASASSTSSKATGAVQPVGLWCTTIGRIAGSFFARECWAR